MLKLVVRGIVDHLGRLVLTVIAVTLGVSAVAGSFILADSLRSVFSDVVEQSLAGIDAQVRTELPEDAGGFDVPESFDEAVVEELVALPEVGRAQGQATVFEQIYTLDDAGEVIRPLGPPVLAISWSDDSASTAFEVVDGEGPVGRQIVVDEAQATDGGFAVGDQVEVVLPNGTIESFELSGIVDFGSTAAGAYFVLMDLPTLQEVTDRAGLIDAVDLAAAPGVSPSELIRAVTPVLPGGLEVVSSEDLAAEGEETVGQIIDIFGNVLLGFAFVILFVSIFIIYNTFVILVGQRTRQLGLLRSIGASSNQIRMMVLLESLLIGLISSGLGLVLGIGVAEILKWVFSQGGGEFPDGPTQIQLRTVLVVVGVGLVVTVGSALIPAFRAAKVMPLEAIRDGGRRERSITFRVVAGSLVLVPGLVAFGLALAGSFESTFSTFVMLGVGGALIFIGVAMLSALFAGAVASVLGRPVETIKGITGRLARDNASRNPQRTSATATALMIGLALITGVGVLTASIIDNTDQILEDAFSSDLVIYAPPQGIPFTPVLVEPLSELEEVAAVSGYSAAEASIADDSGDVDDVDLRAWDSATGIDVINMGIVEGSAEIGADGVAVYTETADERGLALGDTVEFDFGDGATESLTVEALYENPQAVDGVSWLIDREVAIRQVQPDTVFWIGVTFAGDRDPASAGFQAARDRVEEVIASQPQLETRDNAEFREELVGQINQLQFLIVGLLVMCIVVAFFGIVNTMVLSILERTREIGLLRAVGTTRGQLRSSIRWEAVIVSLFGSLLGVIMGVALGWAAVSAIPDEFLSFVSIPWIQIVIYLLIGAVIGVVAALFPGARAARLNVLDAIAYE